MAEPVDLREVSQCTCFRLRRAARRTTQLYDQLLAPAGLTVGQFSLLAHLLDPGAPARGGTSVGALSDRLGMDPTTLSRNLKPLMADGLVAEGTDPQDRRRRVLSITRAGRRRFCAAVPRWRQAQARMARSLGDDTLLAMNGLLDRTVARLGG